MIDRDRTVGAKDRDILTNDIQAENIESTDERQGVNADIRENDRLKARAYACDDFRLCS